jgi:hypothetical protein
MGYDKKWNRYRIRFSQNEFKDSKEILSDLLKLALENSK